MTIDARTMWGLFETYHSVTYFSAEARAATDALGCTGGWMGYFGTRSAPLGEAGPELVVATFYTFHPDRVASAIPQAWQIASPGEFLRTRLSGVDAALRGLLADQVLDSAGLAAAAVLVKSAAERAQICGRPLAAANAALPWPREPHLVLWHAATRLRESRGDGHLAALLTAGLGPCEALVTFCADRGVDPTYMREARGWSAREWAAAERGLVARELLTEEGRLTEKGAAARRWVEQRTDEEAAMPWQAIGSDATNRVAELLKPISTRIAEQTRDPGLVAQAVRSGR